MRLVWSRWILIKVLGSSTVADHFFLSASQPYNIQNRTNYSISSSGKKIVKVTVRKLDEDLSTCSRGAAATFALSAGCLSTPVMAATAASWCSSDTEGQNDVGVCLQPHGALQRFHTSWFLHTSKHGLGQLGGVLGEWRALLRQGQLQQALLRQNGKASK